MRRRSAVLAAESDHTTVRTHTNSAPVVRGEPGELRPRANIRRCPTRVMTALQTTKAKLTATSLVPSEDITRPCCAHAPSTSKACGAGYGAGGYPAASVDCA